MELIYAKDRYVADGTVAIRTFIEEEGYMEPYGDVTICLAGYGLKPQDGYIYMPTYKMPEKYLAQVIEDVVEEVVGNVRIGYGEGIYAKLKPNWENGVRMMENPYW